MADNVAFADGLPTGVNGLLGLAYPFLTSTFINTTSALENPQLNIALYSPVVNSMVVEGSLDAPEFSLAINRDTAGSGFGGILDFGGVPALSDPRVNASATVETVNIEKLARKPLNLPVYQFYAIDVSCISTSEGEVANSSGRFILDSGTTLNYVQPSLAQMINAAFEPAAVFSEEASLYLVDCNTTAADIEISIGGTAFPINPSDLKLADPGLPDGVCISGFQSTGQLVGSNPQILGDVFLKNVLATFNLENETVSLSSRPYYQS
jgi:hypothetical protein